MHTFVALVLFLSFLTQAAHAQNRDAFNGLDAWELSRGILWQTTCEFEGADPATGRSYCFASEAALVAFQQNLDGRIDSARAVYRALVLPRERLARAPLAGYRPAASGPTPLALALQKNTLYMNNFSSSSNRLYTVNASSAAAQQVGPMNRGNVTDVAFKGASLFGITFTAFLTVNPQTGASTVKRDIGNNMDDINALAFHGGSNKFYAAGVNGKFISIDPATGRGTLIGNYGNGLGSSGDLAFGGNGTLYGSLRKSGTTNDFLATVNRSTGKATLKGSIGHRDVWGLVFRNGVLLGVTKGGKLLRINTSTGAGTIVGSNGIKQAGLTVSPP